MRLFRRNKTEETDYLDELEITSEDNEAVYIKPEPMQAETLEQKKQTIENCCDRIMGANSRIAELKVEYQTVNSYLTDIQIIEELPDTQEERLKNIAKKVVVLDKDRRDFGRSMAKLSEKQFGHMKECEDDIKDILKQMSEDESYCQTVKTDMKYLEGEKAGLKMEIQEYKNKLYLINGASKIGIIAFAVLFLLFLIVNYEFNKDTSLLIYLLIGITAIFAAGIFYLHNQTINELRLSEIKYNRAIGLLNKIKLKYVNIAGRLTYSYEKHGVKSAYQLNKIWGAYLTLKKEHEVYNKASSRLADAEDELVQLLKNMNVKDQNVWISQAYAIINPSDMNEIKNHLMNRRNSLKKSLDYNTEVIGNAREEVKNIIMNDKENSTELMGILDAYEEKL